MGMMCLWGTHTWYPEGSLMKLVHFFHLYRIVVVALFRCLTFVSHVSSLVVILTTGFHHSPSHALRAHLLWKRNTECQKQTVKDKHLFETMCKAGR